MFVHAAVSIFAWRDFNISEWLERASVEDLFVRFCSVADARRFAFEILSYLLFCLQQNPLEEPKQRLS